MRAALCTVLGVLGAVGCIEDVRTPLLIADGELAPPRDRGPPPDERIPDARAPLDGGFADDIGDSASRDGGSPAKGDAGCIEDHGLDGGRCPVDGGSTAATDR